jgi:hypothetical protein
MNQARLPGLYEKSSPEATRSCVVTSLKLANMVSIDPPEGSVGHLKAVVDLSIEVPGDPALSALFER